MTKAKTTRHALLMSVLSMMLCMAMLVSSTFAWFTDSVTSGNNRIVAGNLDVELSWSTDGKTWERVKEDTDMFKDTLWEPGYTRIVYLKVENVGSLALKYRIGINVANKVLGKNAKGEDIDLSNYIKFGVVNDATVYSVDDAGRTAAINAVKAKAVTVAQGYSSDEAHLSKYSESGIIALVVYMPGEETGNDANYKTSEDPTNPTKYRPSIDLGISVVATQWTEEPDSFGDDYDENAEYPVIPTKVATTDEFVAAIGNGEDVALTEDIALTDIVNVTNDVTIYANGKTITNAAPRLLWADNDDVTVTIVNANLVSTNTGNGSRGVQINANRSNVDLIVKDSTITMNNVADNYGVNICGGVTGGSLTLKNCEITAYQCVNIYGSDMTVNIEGCTFTYVNTHNKGWSGGFITLFCSEGCKNIDLTVKNTQFITGTVAEGCGYPHNPVYLREPNGAEGHTITFENCTWDGAAYTYSE